MRATFTLSDEQFAANERAGIMVGLPLAVQLDAGPLLSGRDEGAGWFERVNYGPAAFKPLDLERCVFCGRFSQIETWRDHGETVCQALLDCGLPLRIDLLDPEPAQTDRPGVPFGLAVGDWLMGMANLRGLAALDVGDLLWQPVQGTIVDIQRLVLDPTHPSFGTLRWLHGLPRQSFAPDQVFITVNW
jgi:hypothetical protein